jgi:glycosyltransferase involved in cell wall biosynthesis
MAPISPSAPVSVAMITYNGARFVEAQLRSILDQLRPDDELLVVDDASTDDTVARVRGARDPRIRLLLNPRNGGVRTTVERALRATTGDPIFLADQDDIWLPGKRAALSRALSADSAAIGVVTDAQVIDAGGKVTEESFMRLRGGFRAGLRGALGRNCYLGCSMAVRRRLLDVALPLPQTIPMHDIWFGAVGALLDHWVYVDEPLIQYRRHEGNASPGRPAGIGQMLRWRTQLALALAVRWPTIRAARRRR